MGLCLVAAFAMGAVVATSASATAGSGSYIVTLNASAGDPGKVAANEAQRTGARVSMVYRHALRGFAATIPADKLALVRADPRVESVTVDAQVYTAEGQSPHPGAKPTECEICEISQITTRWARRVGANQSSTHSGDGTGSVSVNVAVLDSGIQPDQPDLNVVSGTNCTNKGKTPLDFADHSHYGHGTIVGGEIGALDNAIGVVGVAPGARLWAVRVLNRRLIGSTSAILCGIDWVTSTRTDGDPSNDIAVANMSLIGYEKKTVDDGNCGRTTHDVLHEAICRSVAAGVTYVAGAGNDRLDLGSGSPASYSEVLTATAIADSDGAPGAAGGPNPCDGSPDDTAASFSNFATQPEDEAHTVAAPGVCISSTWIHSGAATGSGTSFAAPIVTGTVALCIYSGPCAGLPPAQIVSKIVADAAAYNTANPGYGFSGDPLQPELDRFDGYLIYAGQY